MDWDHLAEQQSQHLFASWLKILVGASPALPLRLAQKHRPDSEAVEASEFLTGAFNVCSIVTFSDGARVVVRFPILGRSRFRVEKTNDELLIIGFLSTRIRVPIPRIFGTGMWACGPYTVIAFAEGPLLSKCLSSSLSLPDVCPGRLRLAYRAMAGIMLELNTLSFPRIGSVGWEIGQWKIAKRPLSLSMNELVRVANVPPGAFRQDSFQTSAEYFEHLAQQHLLHLRYQRNDAFADEDDCRKQYIARCLFRRLVRRLRFKPSPFRLWCDDFRPGNVIVTSESDFSVQAVIDWEFTYAAPVEFSQTAPWWLLLESPEAWEEDLTKFLDRFLPRLQIFLEELRSCEDERLQAGSLKDEDRLSGPMAQSMENGMFWVCLAARKGFMFDHIYWKFLDTKFFGPFQGVQERLRLLSPQEAQEMDEFISLKMQQREDVRLEEHLTIDEIMEL